MAFREDKVKWIIGLSVLAVGIGIVLASLLPSSMQYYVTVEELLAEPQRYANSTIKVAGLVAEESIKRFPDQNLWEFKVEKNAKTIFVSFQGIMPDTFKEGAEVVVTGRFTPPFNFKATEVLAKCASRYEEKLGEPLTQPVSEPEKGLTPKAP